jgi:hypothetical protein
MAYFAELDENNYVKQVISVSNDEIIVDGIESEAKGIEFCQLLLGGNWIQTSYNARIRKNFAGVGYFYDSQLDAFISPQPFESWLLDTETCKWIPPVPYPNDKNIYFWDEDLKDWVNG